MPLLQHTPRAPRRRHLTVAPLLLAALVIDPAAGSERDILFTSSENGRNDQIWRMRADGTESRPLTPPSALVQERFPVWSPDGRTVAFLSNRHGPGKVRPAIFLMSADGSSAWKVGPESIPYQGAPDFSPDGSQLVFAGGTTDGGPLASDLYVMDVRGENIRRLTHFDALISCPRWSPDGERVLFAKDMDELLVVDVASGRVSEALPSGIEGTCGDWSPDGSKLAFSTGRYGQLPDILQVMKNPSFSRELYVLDLRSGDLTRLAQAGPHATYPRWSRDGRRIVFQAHIPPDEAFVPGFMPVPGVSELYVMRADGTEVRRLTWNAHLDGHPNW
jgi:TolB protein